MRVFPTRMVDLDYEESLQSLLNRSRSERYREYKYRLAQCMIFGAPVVALYFLGPKLGGTESTRWIGLLQALLAAWCLYIGALPPIVEGVLLVVHRKLKPEPLMIAIVSLFGVAVYLLAIILWIMTLTGHPRRFTALFGSAVELPIIGSIMGLLQHRANQLR